MNKQGTAKTKGKNYESNITKDKVDNLMSAHLESAGSMTGTSSFLTTGVAMYSPYEMTFITE